MTTLDWSQCPAVESVPGRLSGAWVFKDTRMPVSTVFGNDPEGATRYSPAQCLGTKREAVIGSPEPKHISTSTSRDRSQYTHEHAALHSAEERFQ
jgi:hypothetical protein